MNEKIIVFALYGDEIADTAGSAEEFLLFDGYKTLMAERHCGIVQFLAACNADIFVCGGIGNCLLEVLLQKGIRVIPGVCGKWKDALENFRTGTLTAGERYTCTERGQICGDCKGNY